MHDEGQLLTAMTSIKSNPVTFYLASLKGDSYPEMGVVPVDEGGIRTWAFARDENAEIAEMMLVPFGQVETFIGGYRPMEEAWSQAKAHFM